MRIIRLLLVAVLAIILIGIAMANGQMVTLHLFPANFDRYLGGTWSVTLPMFLVILLAIAVGMVLGLIWEWLRESHMRSESQRRAERVQRLENEVSHLRHETARPKDEVLAIMDRPKPKPALPQR